MGVRPCRTEMLPPITARASAPTTPYPHLRQCSDRRPPHPLQFAISCPIYLCEYPPIYIGSIAFACNFYKPEHYGCSLMRVLRDVDLHRPATRRRRHVELRTQPCTSRPRHISVVPPPHTEPTNACSRISETTTTETTYVIYAGEIETFRALEIGEAKWYKEYIP
jgi:hypothetical protein